MPARDPDERKILSKIAAYDRWAKVVDRPAATRAARAAMLAKQGAQIEAEVDASGPMGPEEREQRIAAARKAHYARLALKSHHARRARELADRLTAEVEADLLGGAA